VKLAHLARIGILLCGACLVVTTQSVVGYSTAARQSAAAPPFAHVVVIVMENTSASSIIGNTGQAPYINSLAAQYSYSSNNFAVAHPSLPNYLALTGASTFGITTDCSPAQCPVNATNLMDRVESAGLTWKAYMEGMPAACSTTDSYPYAVKHNPFVYYNNIRNNASRCQSHVVPFTQVSGDFASASTTPAFAWITPDMCHDMHDCSIATGDAWLSTQIPAILSSPAFTTQNSVLLLTWDEDDFSGNNRVDLVVAGPQVNRGYISSAAHNHYSMLSTIENAWNLAALTSNDSTATPMTEFFGASNPSTPCSGAALTATPPPSQMAGTAVLFTGSAGGCPNPQYRFLMQQPSGSWQVIQDYSSLATYSWNSTGAPGGSEHFGVWVRDTSSAAAYDTFTSIPYMLTTLACGSITASATPLTPSTSGTSITITASASTCPNPRDAFWMRASGLSTWQLVQGYSTSTTYRWNSSGALPGTEQFGVWIRDASSGAAYDTYASLPYTVTLASCTSVNASASPVSPSVSGMSVTISGAATGCPNALYAFWMLPQGSTTWQLVQGYSTTATYRWNSTGALPGTERFSVWVRDASGAIYITPMGSYDAYAGIAYSVT
jgi:hypothetical protein